MLVPDEAVRKRIWRSLGGPGMALVDGEVAGLWRPRKKGKRLVVELEPLRKLTRSEREALAAEAERLAPFRDAETRGARAGLDQHFLGFLAPGGRHSLAEIGRLSLRKIVRRIAVTEPVLLTRASIVVPAG